MLHLWIVNIPKPLKSCKSIPCSIDLFVHACRLKTLILNDNKLTCISLRQDERGFKESEGETNIAVCAYIYHMLCMCT